MSAPSDTYAYYNCGSDGITASIGINRERDLLNPRSFGVNFRYENELGVEFTDLAIYGNKTDSSNLGYPKVLYEAEDEVVEVTIAVPKNTKPLWYIRRTAQAEEDVVTDATYFKYQKPIRRNTYAAMARLAAYYMRRNS